MPPVVALVIVDMKVQRVAWQAWPVWGWIALFALTAGMGAWMLSRAAARDGPSTSAA